MERTFAEKTLKQVISDYESAKERLNKLRDSVKKY
jgi:hypothetical protein